MHAELACTWYLFPIMFPSYTILCHSATPHILKVVIIIIGGEVGFEDVLVVVKIDIVELWTNIHLNSDAALLKVHTLIPYLTGMGLVKVYIFVPISVPLLTCGCYLHRFPYLCQSLLEPSKGSERWWYGRAGASDILRCVLYNIFPGGCGSG